MFNPTMKIAVSFFFMFQLVGCGGGGSDTVAPAVEEDITNESANESTNVDIIEESIEEATVEIIEETDEEKQALINVAKVEMSELVADEDFEFTSKQQIDVTLNLIAELETNGQTGKRAYVSIYRDYQLLEFGEFYPDASSRVIAGELEDGVFNHSFTNLDNQSDYLIEVWFYDGEKPLQKEQSIASSALVW